MLRKIIVLALAWALSAVAIADDKEELAGAESMNTSDVQSEATNNGEAPFASRPAGIDIDDVSGIGHLNHLGIGFAVGLYGSRIGSEFIFPNGKPGGSILKPFTPIPGGDDGVIDDGGLNPGGGGINPGEGPCFNCTVNPSPDD